MARRPEIGSIQLYPLRPLRQSDRNGFVLKFYCPVRGKRIRKNCGTRDRREARRVLRECRERLLDGRYVSSNGAITEAQELTLKIVPLSAPIENQGMTWQDCYERYRSFRSKRSRERSLVDSLSRICIAERILLKSFGDANRNGEMFMSEVITLDSLEFLQERFLAGDECRYSKRSRNTVNSMLAAVMAFVRFCHKHGWIEKVPAVEKLETRDVMKGRPITGEEFERMLEATSTVVGQDASAGWQFALKVLWESGFRLSELLEFSWDDDEKIHPIWANRNQQHSTIIVPPSQKNGRSQEIPMLPGLSKLLLSVPEHNRNNFVVNLELKSKRSRRVSTDKVSRIISLIGKKASIVVKKANKSEGTRVKYASAHDFRRGCAARLINSGVSAETLKVVMRHADFATTERHYGAIRSAQAAANELNKKLKSNNTISSLVGGLTGGVIKQ